MDKKVFKFKGQTYEVPQGKSLYDVVVENGYTGTKQEFIREFLKLDQLKVRAEALRNKK